jgi:hypothetical protein
MALRQPAAHAALLQRLGQEMEPWEAGVGTVASPGAGAAEGGRAVAEVAGAVNTALLCTRRLGSYTYVEKQQAQLFDRILVTLDPDGGHGQGSGLRQPG